MFKVQPFKERCPGLIPGLVTGNTPRKAYDFVKFDISIRLNVGHLEFLCDVLWILRGVV